MERTFLKVALTERTIVNDDDVSIGKILNGEYFVSRRIIDIRFA